VNQEESEHNEVDGMRKGVDSAGEVRDAYLKERLTYLYIPTVRPSSTIFTRLTDNNQASSTPAI